MQRVKDLILEHSHRFPEFEYHNVCVDQALAHRTNNPDITLEASKSLVEGISKSMLKYLRPYEHHRRIDGYGLKPVVNQLITELAKYDEHIDGDYIDQCVKLCACIGNIRNRRGDISHGHLSPKLETSTFLFAQMIMECCESIAVYLLGTFYNADLSIEESIVYQENAEFNAYLDELYPLEGKPLYSLALYTQYYQDYKIRLESYLYNEGSSDE